MNKLSGPMFEPSVTNFWKSIHDKDGAHYNTFSTRNGIDALRDFFPDGKADEMNFVLFSTSGVHGTSTKIEEAEKDIELDVTFLVVQPRIVCLRYGVCEPKTPEDFDFLKKLRESSWKVIQEIGKP